MSVLGERTMSSSQMGKEENHQKSKVSPVQGKVVAAALAEISANKALPDLAADGLHPIALNTSKQLRFASPSWSIDIDNKTGMA